jgi:hypothetical protein
MRHEGLEYSSIDLAFELGFRFGIVLGFRLGIENRPGDRTRV